MNNCDYINTGSFYSEVNQSNIHNNNKNNNMMYINSSEE